MEVTKYGPSHILANDYSVYELELPNISVDTGTQVYFRLQSVFNGAYDEILSDPQIQYSTIPDSVYEANGMQVNSYKASEDFLVASPQMVTMPFSGKVRVGGEFVKPVTSDSLTLLVVINRNSVDSIVYSKIFPWSDSLIYQLDTLIEIESEDDLSIKVVAPTNVEWSEISIFPQVYYVEAWDSTGQMIDVNGTNDSHKFVFYPAVGYSMLNEVFRRTEAFITPDSMILNVEPLINFKQGILSGQNTPNVSGQVTLSVKSLNKLYARETFQFTIIGFSGGLSYPFPPTISVPVGEDELIFVEYHFNDRNLLDSVQLNATVDGIPSSQYTVGLFSNFPEGKLLLGPLYRGWGQFVYNGNREWADQEIDENELKLNPALSEAGNIPSKNDIDNIEDPNELDSLYNPAYARFIVMIADPKNNMWRGYDDRTWVKALEMSSSRMGRDDVSLDFSMPASGTGLAAPNKLTRSNSKSWSYGGNLPPFVPSLSLSVSYSTSSTTSETIIDVADMNGDRYPDILGKNKIQYTTPEGGRTASGVAHQFSENHIAEGDSWSLGLGGSFAAASTPNSSAPGEGSPKSSVSGPANLFSSMFKCEKAPQTASKAIGLSISPNQSFGKNDDETKHSWLDVNGDGLPDKVFINGNVALNLGYRFAQAEQWGYSAIRKGESEDYSGGSGLGINIGQLSFSAGFGLTRTDNIVKESLQDVNGDGLIDIVKLGDPISVNLNTGNGFTNDLIFWNDANKIETGSSTGESKNIAGTFCIHLLPFLPVVKICGSLNYSDGTGVSKETFQISDVNGDGFPDLLSSSNDGQLNVRPSAIGRTNLLKKVTRPFDSCYFTLTYDRMGNTFEMPQSQWVMTSTAMYDGFFGDGVDWMKYAFEYEGGNYNRREREFYGFHTVKTIQLDAGENDESYRRIVHTYDDSTYYTKGLLLRELTLDANGNKYLETINTYEKIDRFTGQPHPGPALDDAGAVFPRLIKTEKFFYEGVSTPGLQTVFTFVYDEVGNVVEYADFGDNSPDDLLRAFIEYHDNDTKYIKSIPKSISITTPEGEIRYREADMDEYGNVTQIRQYLQGGEAAVYDLSYHDNGNLKRITRPTNHNGERLWFEYEYDDQVQIYVTKVSDAYGYTSSSVYEYLFGQLLETTDINSQKTTYTIDNRGRVTTITGPYELASGKPYTIAFEFNTDVPVPYAKTKHYDPAHNSDIETITFIDGLLRPIQVKKTGSLFIDKNLDDEKVMTVSGRVIFDAFGREVESYFPTTEPDNPALNIVFNSNFDNIPPTRKVYDVLDRTLAVVLPDGTTTSASYGIEEDNGGNTTFKTTESDGLGNKKESYTDIRGRVLAKKDNGPNGDIWTSFHYNLLGELLETTDHDGNKTKYTYDWLGRRLTEDSPVSGQMEMRYDLVGNLTHKITPNIREVNPDSGAIRFTYQLERLIQVDYPESYQNMVRYTYGEPGAEFNRAGRLYLQEDASGGQEFFYGPLGEIVKNIRTVLISNIQITTYVSEYRYDTWNRIDSLIYPDGEVVKYHYNQAGKLESMTGAKGSHEYVYIDKLGYDKFEQRIFLRYGNGTETSYTYEPERRRLSAMDVSDAGGWEFMKNRYTYDAVSNILSISNSMQMQSGSIGGPSSHSFEYDNLYRLIRANGTWSGPVSNHEYSLEMEYSDLGDILRKNQVHLYNGLTQFETTYEHVYQYEDDRPHILTKIDERDYTFDSNGNLTSCIRHNIHHNRRFYGWDEENRLKDVWDDGYLSRYTYDASGERVVKSHGGVQVAYENSAPVGMINHRDNFTAYVSPYLIARGLSYTKFYYIEDQRFLSKIGSGYFLSPLPESPGDYVTAGNIDYRERMKLLAEADSLGFPAPPTPGNPPVPSFSLPAYRQDQPNHFAYDIPRYANENVPPGFNLKNGDEFEDNAYFFHPDHIGSTSYLTNFNGKLRQHVEYFPFGEILMDEHSTNDPLQPYLFTGKELDMETGLYYFGARYYDPELSVWMSVDPMAEKYPGWSPYNYTLLNPVKLVDPDGNFPVETFWDIGNVIVNIGRGVFHELKGNREKANQAWTDLAIDAGAMAIPYLPAGVSKIKYADDVIDATKTIDKTTDAIKATEKAGDGQKIYQTYTKTNPKTGEVYTGRTSGTKSPEENVRLRDRNHHMNEEGFAPAVLDKSSSNRDAIRGREQQLIDLNGGAKSQGGTSGNKIRAISPKNEKANQYLNAAKREFD